VYQPCILAAKKRYVGMAYASPSQAVPTFDAKGIETVRRDTCGIVCKTMERALRLLFERHDLSAVKLYLQRQWAKVQAGRVSVADATFAKEVRLGTYAAERDGAAAGAGGSLPAGAVVAQRALARDPRATPRYGRRVPYVICEGSPKSKLWELVQSPVDFLDAAGRFRLCGLYYVTLQKNALSRLLSLAGGDVDAWLAATPKAAPRALRLRAPSPGGAGGGAGAGIDGDVHDRATITAFYLSDKCAVRVAQGPRACGS
jgi:DNA polymerase zeta